MAEPIYLITDDPQFFTIGYFDDGNPARRAKLEARWRHFRRRDPATGHKYQVWFRRTSRRPEVYVAYWMPPDSPAGRYRVETFIPGRFATTRRAYFTVANNFRQDPANGQTVHDDTFTLVDMLHRYDVWVPLGEYDLEPGMHPESGRVHQVTQSPEDPPALVSFGPVRWVPVPPRQAGAPRFGPPVGTEAERNGPFASGAVAYGLYSIWVGQWFDLNPFLAWYALGYHTGADLNLPGAPSADKDQPIYAVGDGTVTHAGIHGGWGHLVVIEHPDAAVTLPDGRSERRKVYSRYGHTQPNILVREGQAVTRGQAIAFVGAPASAVSAFHLHFDVSYTDKLVNNPAHWPDLTRVRQLQRAGVNSNAPEFRAAQAAIKAEVTAHYVDPLQFLKDNRG